MDFGTDSSGSTEPFKSEPAQLRGCGKPAVIGCLVLLLVVAAGLLILMWKARDLLEFAIVQYREAVIESLPEDMSSAERERLDRAFEAAISAIVSGDLDPAGLQRLQRSLASPPSRGDKLSRAEVLELIQALEAVAGTAKKDGEDPGRQVGSSGWAPNGSVSSGVALATWA
jgi:hypothetical protein